MYYVEMLIDGQLHYRNTPQGQWVEFTSKMLNDRIIELEARLLAEIKGCDDEIRI